MFALTIEIQLRMEEESIITIQVSTDFHLNQRRWYWMFQMPIIEMVKGKVDWVFYSTV